MKRTLWLVGVVACIQASAASSQWLTYDEATRAAKAGDKQTLVLYGSDNCPNVEPALKAFDSPGARELMNGKFTLAYVDIGTSDGDVIAKRGHVGSTPTLQILGADAKEVWRLSSPLTDDDLVKQLRNVLDGRSYAQQERLLNAGSLGPEETFTLAQTYLDRGWTREGHALLRKIKDDPARFGPDLGRRASTLNIEYAPRKQQLKLLDEHLARFPGDMIALINRAHILPLDRLDEKRTATRNVAEGLHDEKDQRLRDIGYRMVVQFAVYFDHASAEWALPYALERLKLEPDLDNLSEVASLAVLAKQPEQIEIAKQLLAPDIPTDKIGDAVAEGMRLAAKSTAAASPHAQ